MKQNTELRIKRPNYDGTQNCYGLDTSFFYIETTTKGKEPHYEMLRTICSDCPFLSECAEYAIVHEKSGFWGGLTAFQRRKIRETRKIKFKDITSYYEGAVHGL